MAESQLVKAIKDYCQLLENKGLMYFTRNNTASIMVTRPDGSTGFMRTGKLGSPDLILCYKGQYIGVETKYGGNKQSKEQVKAQSNIVRAGGKYWIIRSFDDFLAKMSELQGGTHGHQQSIF